jgi:hypothetical protein
MNGSDILPMTELAMGGRFKRSQVPYFVRSKSVETERLRYGVILRQYTVPATASKWTVAEGLQFPLQVL